MQQLLILLRAEETSVGNVTERDVMNCEAKAQETGFWEAEKANSSMFY